ncbi:MAG: hypothetical protein RQ752_06565, partial [Thermohalobaculum sp.]|nr:hypothetical protein [Thermohalobaculum sp.]
MEVPTTARERVPDGGRGRGVMAACEHCAHACWWACRLSARCALAFGMLAVLLAGLGALALRSGPVEMPALAALAMREVNGGQRDVRLSVGTALIGLGRRSGQPALRFRDVEVHSAAGDLLLAVPEMGARFHLGDLIAGEARVTEIVIRGPSAQIVREVDGRWRIGLGIGEGLTLAAPPAADPAATAAPTAASDPATPDAAVSDAAAPDSATPDAAAPDPATVDALAPDATANGFAMVSAILDDLAGGAAPLPELSRLKGVLIRDAALSYRNAATGASWSTEGATLRVRRDADGLTGALGLGLADDPAAPLRTIRVALRRQRGVEGTELDASLSGVRPSRLAGGVPELDWL